MSEKINWVHPDSGILFSEEMVMMGALVKYLL